ncbi:MAG TPA: glycosyltransferase family 9 protein [Fimbriimonas sp.]
MRPDRVLISLKTYLGDAVMASPMIEAIECEVESITIQTTPLVQQLLQDPIRSRSVIPFEKSRKPWATVQCALALRRQRFSTAVLVNRSFRAALVTRLAGIRTRVGHGLEGRRALLTKVVPYDEDRFEADTCMDLARALGIEGPSIPHLTVTKTEAEEGRSLLEGATLGIQPGTRYEAKQIPLAELGEVVCSLQQDGHEVVLIGGPEEVAYAETLQSLLPKRVPSLVGRTDIRRSLGVLANLRLAIGGDTGLLHMAAAVGCPTLTAFGPTNARKWGHAYEPHRIIVAPGGDLSELRPGELITAARHALLL